MPDTTKRYLVRALRWFADPNKAGEWMDDFTTDNFETAMGALRRCEERFRREHGGKAALIDTQENGQLMTGRIHKSVWIVHPTQRHSMA